MPRERNEAPERRTRSEPLKEFRPLSGIGWSRSFVPFLNLASRFRRQLALRSFVLALWFLVRVPTA
jgi:hypothetical protein